MSRKHNATLALAVLAMLSVLAIFTSSASLGNLAAAGAPARAHHGGAAYDTKTTLTLKATVTEFKFANPHSQIYFDVADDPSGAVHWSGEAANPAVLIRQGWTRTTLKPGDHATIIGEPSKSKGIMRVQKVILADGKELRAQNVDLAN